MNEYETKDFYLAVMLQSEGYRIDRSYKTPEGVYFVFEILNKDKFDKLINDYINYKALVNIRRFTSSIVVIRKEIQKHN